MVSVSLNATVFPTAYAQSLTADRYPFITCQIDSVASQTGDVRVSVEASIQGLSTICSDTIVLQAGRVERVYLLPKLEREQLLGLTEIRPAQCRIQVHRHSDNGVHLLFDKAHDFKLHAYDTALLATLDANGQVKDDLTDYLAVFVTPHIAIIEQLVAEAAELRPELAMVGYQGGSDLASKRAVTRSQANAFFNVLKRQTKLLYTNSPLNFGKLPGEITQRVRFPATSLSSSTAQANCIDGSVLFASLLECIGIQPVLVVVRGHAFVGWRVWRDIQEYDFLESTMIGSSTFKEALDYGNREYSDAVKGGLDRNPLFHPSGFLKLIDIASCRSRGIDPLM